MNDVARFIWVKLHGMQPAKAFRRRGVTKDAQQRAADAWSRSGKDSMDAESRAHTQCEIIYYSNNITVMRYDYIITYVNICI